MCKTSWDQSVKKMKLRRSEFFGLGLGVEMGIPFFRF